MCWVVLDRAACVGERFGGLDSRAIAACRTAAGAVREAALARGYDERLGSFTQRYEHGSVDAAALLVPIVGFLPPDDPRVASTVNRIESTLGFGGFVYRFVPEASEGEAPLPLGEFEGAFLPCTLWMATARAMMGDVDRAEAIVERVERAGGELGLLAEEVDPRTGELLGNYPLLFSHVEHVRAVAAIDRAREGTSPASQARP